MKRKVIALLLVTVMLVCCIAVLAACNKKGEVQKTEGEVQKTEIVYLGDSIAEGILGASPLGLRHEYAYANVIGRRNDYEYYNHSVSGHLTKDLRAILENTDIDYDKARGLLLHVSEADVIHISILGNDLLQNLSMNDVVLEAAQGKYDIINGIAAVASDNIAVIVERLKALNPDALVIFQNVYNPLSENSTLVDETTRGTLASDYNVYPEDLRELGSGILDRLNGVLDDYLEAHPGAFVIADARSEFDRIFEEDYERGKALIYPDYIHPSNEGHAVLADLTQGILEERGLADAGKALSEYKAMRKNVLAKYFDGIVTDAAAVNAAIDAAADCKTVTEVFFDATRGHTPDYSDIDSAYADRDVSYVSEERDFGIYWETSTLWDIDFSSESINLIGILVPILVDNERSGVTLRPDGTMEVKLILDAEGVADNLDISEILGQLDLDMDSFIKSYVEPIMPGFDTDDILGSLQRAKDSLGVSFVSDGDTDAFVEELAALLFSGEIPTELNIPEGFGIVIESSYTLKEVVYPDGTKYTGVYLTPSDPDTQSYLVFSLYEEDGAQWLNAMVDFIKLDLVLYAR